MRGIFIAIGGEGFVGRVPITVPENLYAIAGENELRVRNVEN